MIKLSETSVNIEGIIGGNKKAAPLPIGPLSQGRLQIGTAKNPETEMLTLQSRFGGLAVQQLELAITGPRLPDSLEKDRRSFATH